MTLKRLLDATAFQTFVIIKDTTDYTTIYKGSNRSAPENLNHFEVVEIFAIRDNVLEIYINTLS